MSKPQQKRTCLEHPTSSTPIPWRFPYCQIIARVPNDLATAYVNLAHLNLRDLCSELGELGHVARMHAPSRMAGESRFWPFSLSPTNGCSRSTPAFDPCSPQGGSWHFLAILSGRTSVRSMSAFTPESGQSRCCKLGSGSGSQFNFSFPFPSFNFIPTPTKSLHQLRWRSTPL